MLLKCGRTCIPHSRPPASKPAVAGSNTECAPERAENLKWHHILVQAGRPTTGVFIKIMRATRKRYHEATKRILSSQNEQRNTQIVDSCENSSHFHFGKRFTVQMPAKYMQTAVVTIMVVIIILKLPMVLKLCMSRFFVQVLPLLVI